MKKTFTGRTEKCSVCGLDWNVSAQLVIRSKYICPVCTSKRRDENMKKALATPVLKTLLLILLIGMFSGKVTVQAAVIRGEQPLAGFSKVIDDFFVVWGDEAPAKLQQIEQDILKSKKIRQLINAEGAEDILIRIVEAEATDGTLEQKVNVASCVINRCLSDEWPDSIENVIFQKNQFSPVNDGRYYSVSITESSREAVKQVYESGTTHDCIFFCSYGCKSKYFEKKGEPDFRDGIHRYYKK